MDINEAIAGRHSIRDYTTQVVGEDVLRRLISAAVLAPNAVNEQPCTFTVVRDQALLDTISRKAKTYMLATMPAGAHSGRYRSMLSDESLQIFHHAPVLVLISGNSHGPWIVEDCALAAENLMLAAYASGLGTCWIGFAQTYLGTQEGRQALGLPSEWEPVAPIVMGYPKATPQPVPRKPPEIRWIDSPRA